MTLSRLLRADAPPAAVLIRLLVGLVFTSEGIQKFLYAETQGAGRFAKTGIAAADVMGPHRWGRNRLRLAASLRTCNTARGSAAPET